MIESKLNLTVLVVDDNQINQLLLKKVLDKLGVISDFASDGLEAVEKITTNLYYDAVLMDIYMPQMDGLAATRKIRENSSPYFQNIPIIALTASMMTSELNEIEASGMNDYIIKPFDTQVLFDKLSIYQKV